MSTPSPEAEAYVAHHFPSHEVQTHAIRLGMWLFLATEVLLFAGVFTAYALYRGSYPEAFAAASHHLDLTMGTLNTLLLVTSSFTVVMAHHSASQGKNRPTFYYLAASIVMGLGFLVIKGFEYAHKFHVGALPGKFYTMAELQLPGASMFFTVYFLATGLHALHVCVGLGVLAFVAYRAFKGRYSAHAYTGVENGGLYWHLVDLVWIYLYPLLYLID
jgi:cytochrome c oxidase subunit 3